MQKATQMTATKRLVLTAVNIALCLVLPMAFHSIPNGGKIMLPMHIPVLLAGFLCVLGEKMLRGYEGRIVNVHPSLIPAFCGDGFYGLHVHEAALERGVKVTGATVHLVNEVTDGGPILLQKAVEVLPNDTPESLQKRVMEQAEWVLLPQAVSMLCQKIEKEKHQ